MRARWIAAFAGLAWLSACAVSVPELTVASSGSGGGGGSGVGGGPPVDCTATSDCSVAGCLCEPIANGALGNRNVRRHRP